MRKTISSVLIGLGASLLLVGALIHFYAYPQLAKTPVNLTTDTSLQALGATIFDSATLKPVTVDLNVSAHTVADSSAQTPSGVTVWTNTTTVLRGDVSNATCDKTVAPKQPGCFQYTADRAPFDSVSGAGVDCPTCVSANSDLPAPAAQFIDGSGGRVNTVFCGEVFKFPFDTQKHTYPQWDDTTRSCRDAAFAGEQKIDGLNTFKFVQTIPATTVGHQEVPGSIFGLKDATVTADLVYSMVRTLWIEPVTGAPVNRTDQQTEMLSYHGKTVPAFVGTIAYTGASVTDLTDLAKSKAPFLHAMKLQLPLGAGLVGLVSLAGGLLLRRRSTTPPTPVSGEDRTLVSA